MLFSAVAEPGAALSFACFEESFVGCGGGGGCCCCDGSLPAAGFCREFAGAGACAGAGAGGVVGVGVGVSFGGASCGLLVILFY